MKIETATFLAKAHQDLRDAQKIMTVGVTSVAARCAYYAAFHAAEALICEWTGRMPKTHRGVHSEFARLVKDRREIGKSLHAFLTRAYKHKQDTDYGPIESEDISKEESIAAIPMAIDFVARVETLLAEARTP